MRIVTLCQSLFRFDELNAGRHRHKRRDSSVGMYQRYQLERTVEFELKSRIINREYGSNSPSGHTCGVNVGCSEGISSYKF